MDWKANWIYWGLLAIFIPMCLSIMITEIVRAWVDYRSRSKALDLLRFYAERGEEPPASVTEAVAAVGSGQKRAMGAWSAPGPAPKPSTRERYLAHVAANIVFVLGFAGIAWWRMPTEGPPGPLVMWAVVGALFFAAAIAAQLVGVFTTPSGRSRDDR